MGDPVVAVGGIRPVLGCTAGLEGNHKPEEEG